jgi:phage baseplate assembly protein W
MSNLEKNLYKNLKIETQKQDPIPIVAGMYRGLSTVNPNSKEFKIYDLGLIKQDLINHFHIRKGEKLENPNFGTIIWDVLYDPLTEVLKNEIVKDVTEVINYDPRVTVNKVSVDTYEYGIQISCELTYLTYNISEQLVFKFNRENQII